MPGAVLIFYTCYRACVCVHKHRLFVITNAGSVAGVRNQDGSRRRSGARKGPAAARQFEEAAPGKAHFHRARTRVSGIKRQGGRPVSSQAQQLKVVRTAQTKTAGVLDPVHPRTASIAAQVRCCKDRARVVTVFDFEGLGPCWYQPGLTWVINPPGSACATSR